MILLEHLVSIIVCIFHLCYANLLPQTISGSLRDYWDTNFTISTKRPFGNLLQLVDSKANQLDMFVEKRYREEMLVIKFNGQRVCARLDEFCSCTSREDHVFTIRIRMKHRVIRAQCNKCIVIHFNLKDLKEGWTPSNNIKISLGYLKPSRENTQLLGCLHNFYFKTVLINFNSKKDEVDSLNGIVNLSDCNQHTMTGKITTVKEKHKVVNNHATSSKFSKNKAKLTVVYGHTTSSNVSKFRKKRSVVHRRTPTPNVSKFKENNKVIRNRTDSVYPSHLKGTRNGCFGECMFWKVMSVIETIIVMALILFINRAYIDQFIQKMKLNSPSIDIAVIESVPGSHSLYSSIKECARRQSKLGSDDGYLIPRIRSIIENRPTPPPRDAVKLFRRVNAEISQTKSKSNECPETPTIADCLWKSFIESLYKVDEFGLDIGNLSSLPSQDK